MSAIWRNTSHNCGSCALLRFRAESAEARVKELEAEVEFLLGAAKDLEQEIERLRVALKNVKRQVERHRLGDMDLGRTLSIIDAALAQPEAALEEER